MTYHNDKLTFVMILIVRRRADVDASVVAIVPSSAIYCFATTILFTRACYRADNNIDFPEETTLTLRLTSLSTDSSMENSIGRCFRKCISVGLKYRETADGSRRKWSPVSARKASVSPAEIDRVTSVQRLDRA